MSFMKKQVYFGGFFAIETTTGTEIIPDDVIGRTVGTDVSAFLNYLEGTPLNADDVIEHETGWLARMSAPGYMDCTSWGVYESENDANGWLDLFYGDEE